MECREDILDLGTEELGSSSKGIPILSQNALVVVDVRLFLLMVGSGGEGTSLQELIDGPGDLDLTGVGSALVVDEWIKRGLGSQKSLDSHGGKDLCKQCKVDGIVESQ